MNIFGKKNTEEGIPSMSSDMTGKIGATKLVHVVKMMDGEVGARKDMNLTPGTTVSDVRKNIKCESSDSFIRGKNRQILNKDTDLYAIAEPGEKFIITPDTEVGVY